MAPVIVVALVWAALLVGFGLGDWWVTTRVARRPAWPVVCGECRRRWDRGPRRQLKLELWDTYGMLYESWPTGVGEFLDTRPVTADMVDRIARAVRRVNDFQRGETVAEVTEAELHP